MPRRRKAIKVVERKLRRELSFGTSIPSERLIEIDPRLRPKVYLNTLLHELLHIEFPSASDYKVRRAAGQMTRAMWGVGYRKVQE